MKVVNDTKAERLITIELTENELKTLIAGMGMTRGFR